MFRLVALGLLGLAATACDPERNVGTWPCTSSSGPYGQQPDGGAVPYTGPIELPWSNGFEDGFCGYAHAKGYCYLNGTAEYTLVDAPVHSGVRAARFVVTAMGANRQTRCVREGALPPDATYGAWYFFPERPTSADNWNLMMVQATPGDHGAELWDVSIRLATDGTLHLRVLDHEGYVPMDQRPLLEPDDPELPIGSWVFIEFRWRRATTATGEIQVLQDGESVIHIEDIQTDRSDNTWAQWYVGNLVANQTPSESTVYVDDVSIRQNP